METVRFLLQFCDDLKMFNKSLEDFFITDCVTKTEIN